MLGVATGSRVRSYGITCKPCGFEPTPKTLSFTVEVSGSPFLGSGSPGTFGGVSYANPIFAGVLDFHGPSFSATVLSQSLVLTAPFSMTGNLTGFANGH